MAQSGIRNSENAVSVSENENILALKLFLENASEEQNELKWIDQIVHKMKLKQTNSENSAKQESTYSSRSAAVPAARIEETREKRCFNANRNSEISARPRKRKYDSHDFLGLPERIYSDEEMKFKRNANNSDFRCDKTSSRSIDKPINEEMEVSKDLLSKRDNFMFSYKKPKYTMDRWLSDYETVPEDFENSGTVLSEKSQTMKEANADELPLSLETLKQTVLELRNTLIESNKGTSRNGNVTNISRPQEYDRQVEKDTRKEEGHAKSEHESDMPLRDLKKSNNAYGYTGNVEKSSSWWDDSRPAAEIFDLKRRDNGLENASYSQKSNNLEDKNEVEISHLEEMTQRVKRKRKNNEEKQDSKLFQRAGLGELCPEILNDHRRSKKSVKRGETLDAIEAHSQSIIRQTTRNNSQYSVERRNKLLIDKSVLPNTTYDPNYDCGFRNHKENEITNLNQNKNDENQKSEFETKRRNKNLSNIITEDKDEISEQNDFDESLLFTNLILNESPNMSDISFFECKVVNKNIRDDNLQDWESNPILEENYVNETRINQNFWNSKEPKIIFHSKVNPLKLDQTSEFTYEMNHKTANDNIIKYPEICYLRGGKSKKPEKKSPWVKEINNHQRNVLMTDIKRGSQHITGADRIMKLQHRMGRRILQDSATKNQNLYENPLKFHKRANKIDRFGKSFKRSQNKEKDENMEDNQDEELGKSSAAQNEKLDLGEYEDQGKEDSVQNYDDEEDETEDYENELKRGERSKIRSLSGLYPNTEDGYVRKRHVPVVQYFDYQGDANDEDEEMPIMANIEFKRRDTPRRKSDTYPQKKNKQKDEEEKLDKDKKITKNKTPKEEFIGNINVPEMSQNETLKETLNPKNFPFRGEMKRGKESQGEARLNYHRSERDPHIWSDQSSETQKLLKALNKDNGDSNRLIFAEPLEYNLKVRGKLKAGAISDFLSNDLPLEERLFTQDNDLLSFGNNDEDYEPQRNEEYRRLEDSDVNQENDLGTKYEELENTNAWEGPIRKRSRLRGDHRMNLDSEEASDTRRNRFDGYSEGSCRNWYQKERDRIGNSDTEEKSYKNDEGNQISEKQNSQSEDQFFGRKPQEQSSFHTADDRKSGSSYLALKNTDDMFKGGIEQSKPSEEKTSNGLIPSQKTSEWKVMKAGDSSTNSENEKINAKESPESRFEEPVIEADFIFKEEDIESPEEIARKKNKDSSRDKRSILNSDDLMHESFVESLDWMNDFGDDDDRKVRIGRGLKSFQENKKIANDNIGFPYSEKVKVLTNRSNFEKNNTVTNIITIPVQDELQNSSIEPNFELTLGGHLNDADTYTTKSQHDYTIQNNKIKTFFAHEKQPDIEHLRVRRKAFGRHRLVNGKSKHIRNNLNRWKRQFKKFQRAAFRNYKNRNRRHKYSHGGNYNNGNEKNWQSMKKYSPEEKHFQKSANKLKKRYNYSKDRKVKRNESLKKALASKLFRTENPEKTGEQEILQWMLSDKTNSEALPCQVKQSNNIVKYIGIKEAEGESHKPLHNEVDKKWHSPAYAFQYQSPQLKHHNENKPAYKKSLSSFDDVPSIMKLRTT